MATTLVFVAVVVLGLTAGALLAEAAILVPYWRSLPPDTFLEWYRENGALLMRFFAPLEIAATLIPILAAIANWLSGAPAGWIMASSLLSILVLGTFPLYFKKANASFAEGSIETDRVTAELRRWAHWHQARVVIATAAFVTAILAAAAGPPAAS